ncbi:MAG: hypothetical protein OEL54_00940 [Flavobacteriaceae bacterium]|nr:hypothetical protein [Flavobacteriaceae bacterium]
MIIILVIKNEFTTNSPKVAGFTFSFNSINDDQISQIKVVPKSKIKKTANPIKKA